MIRAGNMVGSFVTEDHDAGRHKRPWTAEDEQRLRGEFKLNGRATKPHVNTPAGPYAIGSVSLWCTRSVGQRKDGAPIICARRKSKASDAACADCTRGT